MGRGELRVQSPYTMPIRALGEQDFVHFCHLGLGVTPARVRGDIERWLDEDQGTGDVTVFSGFEHESPLMDMYIVAKENFVLAGLPLMAEVFRAACGSSLVSLFSDVADGAKICKGDVVLAGKGFAPGLLLGERVALNFASHLSGVATKTADVIAQLERARAGRATPVLLETRKTTPGLRLYEKYATRVGGARNHRHGLDSGAMLKENHLRSIGNISIALARLKARTPILSRIEIEVSSLEEFRIALVEGADVIMLDNFAMPEVRLAVAERNSSGRAVALEVSGNLDQKDLTEIAESGVDYASMGALIHKAVWIDISLQLYRGTRTDGL